MDKVIRIDLKNIMSNKIVFYQPLSQIGPDLYNIRALLLFQYYVVHIRSGANKYLAP